MLGTLAQNLMMQREITMKIEKETNDKLIITITKEEFKEAFRSPEQLKNFRDNLINL